MRSGALGAAEPPVAAGELGCAPVSVPRDLAVVGAAAIHLDPIPGLCRTVTRTGSSPPSHLAHWEECDVAGVRRRILPDGHF